MEVVTVSEDRAEPSLPFIEKAAPRHPSLIDEFHVLAELFGIVNVPSGIWIDERGTIVRPPEAAFPGRSMFREVMKKMGPLPDGIDPYIRKSLDQTEMIKPETEKYLAALRDWAENGASSRYALSPDEVVERSRPRGTEHAQAAAHFELGQHYAALGDQDAAVEHFKQAHTLDPGNWTYKRQAWQDVSPLLQNARDVYGTSWADEVEASGPENYYPAPDL